MHTCQVTGLLLCIFLVQATAFGLRKKLNSFFPLEVCRIEQIFGLLFYNDPPKLINIGYLGGSYDIFKGNPQAIGQLDPGFLSGQNIFNFTYTQKETTTDGNYLIPDGTTVNSVESCSFSFSSSTTKDVKSYSDSLKVHVDADFKYLGVSFSASADYQKVKQSTETSESVYVSSQASCETYGASIDDAPLSSFFVDDVTSLPTYGNTLTPFVQFIKVYGTHIASSIMMGGRYGLRSEFTTTSYNSMSFEKLNIKAAGGYSGLVSVSASLATEKEKKEAESFNKNRKDVQVFQLGGKPPVDKNGTAYQWAQTVKTTPMPLSYTLTEIYKYLTPQNFPHDKNITIKQSKLKQAIAQYCKEIVTDPDLCDAQYGPKSLDKIKVTSNNIKGYEIDMLPNGFYTFGNNPNLRGFGAFAGSSPYNETVPYVMADRRSTNSNMTRDPIGIVGHGDHNKYLRYKCPSGFFTITDDIDMPDNLKPPTLSCVAASCLSDCEKRKSKYGSNFYYISNGYPELGNPSSKEQGFFRDMSIKDSSPEINLFKCLNYKCLEVYP